MGDRENDQRKLSAFGEIIEPERKLTWHETKGQDGRVRREGFRHISQLARAIKITTAHLWRIIYGERGMGEAIDLQRLATLLANEQVKAGTCPPQEMIARATDIERRLRIALQPPPPPTLTERRAQAIIKDYEAQRSIEQVQAAQSRRAVQDRRAEGQVSPGVRYQTKRVDPWDTVD